MAVTVDITKVVFDGTSIFLANKISLGDKILKMYRHSLSSMLYFCQHSACKIMTY